MQIHDNEKTRVEFEVKRKLREERAPKGGHKKLRNIKLRVKIFTFNFAIFLFREFARYSVNF